MGKNNFLKKKLYTIVKNTLKDEKLINKLKEKEYDEDKQEILNNMKKILSSLDLNKTLEQIILINIGYYSSLEFTEGNFANIDYLSFILKELLSFEKYYELGLISLTLFLEKFVRKEKHYNRYQYNNFDLINLMHQLDKSDIEGLISIVIKGTLQDEKILKNHQDFLQVLCNYLPINFDNIKEISFNQLFDILFMNNLELLEQYQIQFEEYIERNITNIFLKENVFTIFKYIFVNFYDDIKSFFQKLDGILRENLEDKENVSKIIELVYFMERHWEHPFYEKFYREYFNLIYGLRNKRDIMSMGDLLLLFRFDSLERLKNWESIYKPFFEKFLEDFRYFRSSRENNFNVAYEQLEIVVGQRSKNDYIRTLEKEENNIELKYSKISEDIFSRVRIKLDKRIREILPDSVKKFSTIYDNLRSENPEDWSNAVHSCRRILEDLADTIFPPQEDRTIKVNGEEKQIKLGKTNYINRILTFINEHSDSKSFKKLVGSHLKFIEDRLKSVFKVAQKGSHETIHSKEEANRYVIYTYLIVGDILSLIEDDLEV